MKAKKSGKRSTTGESKSPKRSKRSTYWVIIALVALAAAGAFLLYNQQSADKAKPTPASGQAQPSHSEKSLGSAENTRKLVGRWLRPDGGYVIEIGGVDPDGKLQAAYFNPRPINVSRAVVFQENQETKVFIELNDVGYPGATYALTYDGQKDTLTGLYYQPTAGQTFEVVFVRMR